jgi:hypothetical protein
MLNKHKYLTILGLSLVWVVLLIFGKSDPADNILTSGVIVNQQNVLVNIPSFHVEQPESIKSDKCVYNNDCTDKKLCIYGECQYFSNFYRHSQDTCRRCNFNQVELFTNDGQNYVVGKGDGGYTAAGGLQWTVLNGPDYCLGEEIFVPIHVTAKNYNRVYSDEVVMLRVGQTSKVITHPLVKDLQFTLTVKNVHEWCY